MALSCFLMPAYAQWTKHVIDQNLGRPLQVFAADIDNDNPHDLDVIATSSLADDVVWYEAPFWTKHFIDQNLDNASGVYVIDMDDDDDLDVVATGYLADDVVWYEAPFWTKHFIDQDLDGAQGIYVADMDNDNDLDVVATARNASDVVWYEAPFWTKHFIDQDFYDAYDVFVANIDGDNDLDVVVCGLYADDVVWYESSLGVEENITLHQPAVNLLQPFPNPFSDRAEIRYQIPDNSNASLNIYSTTGSLIKQYDNTTLRQSDHFIWDGRNNSGERVPAGVYFVELTAEQYTQMRKLLLVR
jgi:hypothetical protein